MPAARDIAGQRFGRLVAVSPTGGLSSGHKVWSFTCDCGGIKEAALSNVTSGQVKSCGCLAPEVASRAHTKHGHLAGGKASPTYNSWRAMLQRCENPEHSKFKHYGGRGIKVCARWHDFEKFKADMGERPEGTTIDRRNNEKGYTKANCRWATAAEQRANRSKL